MSNLQLFLGGFLIFASSHAQLLESDDFNALTVGNVGTKIDGSVAGQGGFFTSASNGTSPTTTTNADNSNFQVVTSGKNNSNGLKVVSPNGDLGSRYIWKKGLDTAWGNRTTGNEVIDIEFDFFTGAETTSESNQSVRLFGKEGTSFRTLSGYIYFPKTKELKAVAYYKSSTGTIANYVFAIKTGGLILSGNTWYRFGFSYDTKTGEAVWKGTGFYIGLSVAQRVGPFNPVELNFISSTTTTNTSTSEGIFDNYTVTAKPAEALLDINEISPSIENVAIYPNPTKETINIEMLSSTNISKIEISDLNGRIVVTENGNKKQLSIANLSKGLYLMKITTDSGTLKRKILKE